MNEDKTFGDDDERALNLKLDLLEEVLDFLRIIEKKSTSSPDTLDFKFPDLVSVCRRMNVFEVNFRILAQVDSRAKVVIKGLKVLTRTRASQ